MQRAEIIFLALRQLGFEGSFYDATDYLDELAEHKNIDRAYHADIIFNALEKAARE